MTSITARTEYLKAKFSLLNVMEELETKELQGLCVIAEAVHKAHFRDRFEQCVDEAMEALAIAEDDAAIPWDIGDAADRAYDEQRDREMMGK